LAVVCKKSKLQKFSIEMETEETYFDVLVKLAKMEQLLVMCSPRGEIVLDSPGTVSAFDTIDKYNSEIKISYDVSGMYKNYIMKSQITVPASSSTDLWGDQEITISSKAVDLNIIRERNKVSTVTEVSSKKMLTQKVNWEASVRSFKSLSIKASVKGWLQRNDSLWLENTLCRVNYLPLFVNDVYLIESIEYNVNESETGVTLSIVDKNSYITEPSSIIPKKKKKEKSVWL